MNTAQIEAHKLQLDAEQKSIETAISEAIRTKSFGNLADLEKRTDALAEARAELKAAEDTATRSGLFAAKMGDTTSSTDEPVNVTTKAFKPGREVLPLALSDESVRALHKALSSRQSLSVKAFSTVDSLLPPQLAPYILGKIHESRLLDRLPAQAISAPSYEILVHSSTTGAPTPVAEGATKPELVLNATAQTLTAIKLAAHVGISYESAMDHVNFTSYAQNEMMLQILDVENAQLLNGSGSSGNMTGFLHTSGILTHDASTDTGTGETAIDSIEKAIAQLRVGSALATADLLVVHPSTWSAIRRLKDSTGRFLFIASDSDPTRAEANSVFNVEVLTTTAIAAGTGVMMDTQKFGRVLVREGITVHTGQANDDFVKNIQRFVMEERLVLAVERPTAVLAISNLPTA
jgi:HK97 family phage major capsid protein